MEDTVLVATGGDRSAQLLRIMAGQVGIEVDAFFRPPDHRGPPSGTTERPPEPIMLVRLLRAWQMLPSDEDRFRMVQIIEAARR